jgi:hypothetical protein
MGQLLKILLIAVVTVMPMLPHLETEPHGWAMIDEIVIIMGAMEAIEATVRMIIGVAVMMTAEEALPVIIAVRPVINLLG